MPELPTCSDTTVPVSAHAPRTGSQKSVSHRLGRPTAWGRSGRATEVKPRSAFLRISAAASVAPPSHVIPPGTIRSGYSRYHSSWSQSFQARVASRPTSESSASVKTCPQNPVTCDGKFNMAQMPATSMSATRAWTS